MSWSSTTICRNAACGAVGECGGGRGGYGVLTADSGESALGMLAVAKEPDLLLLDLGLPDIQGRDVIKRLRTWSELPVIVISVRDGQDDKVAALDAGADDYVTKPFGMQRKPSVLGMRAVGPPQGR